MQLWSWYCWSWQRHRAGSDRQEPWQLCRVHLLQLLLTARYLTFRIIDRSGIEATVCMHTVGVALPPDPSETSDGRAARRRRGAPAEESQYGQVEPVSFLSRAFGVRPRRPQAVRVQRDLVIPASDGVPLLANRFYPVDIDRPPLVLLRGPYGRGVALDLMPQLLAERGYQVLYQSLRATAGSGGEFDGFTINPADRDGMLWWLREQLWFGGVLATWGASYLGFAQWELAAREIPEWKVGHSGCAVGVRPSVHVSRWRIRAGQCAGLGADRRSHVSCRRWNGSPLQRRLPPSLSAQWSIRSPEQPVHRQARSVTAASRKQQVANGKSRYDHAPAAVRDCAAR